MPSDREPPGLTEHTLPASGPAEALARMLLERVPLAELPSHTVLLPHPGLATPLAVAIGAAAGGPSPLPRRVTLEDWCAEQPVAPVTVSDWRVVSELQRQLGSQKWLPPLDRWAMAAELARLFDELLECEASLPASEDELAALLQRAYEVRDAEPLRFEARLVHDLWFASHGRPGWGITAAHRRSLALAHLAERPPGPLWVFDAARLTPRQRSFVQRYAERQPVYLLRLEVAADADAGWVRASIDAGAGGLAGAAARLRSARAEPPGGVAVFRALGTEAEAGHVCDTVCQWLAEGRPRIAVVATDRALARRLRALLERRGVLLQDAAGWALGTTRVGAGLRAWLGAAANPSAGALAGLLDSPLAESAEPPALAALRGALAQRPPRARVDLVALADALAEHATAVDWLQRLRASQAALGNARRPLHGWLEATVAALEGLCPGLEADPAGASLLEHLRGVAAALSGDAAPRGMDEYAQWLDWSLEQALFRDTGISSPVLLLHPGATRGRSFDAVALCGADAAHLPVPPPSRRLVRDAARRELGLPDAAQRMAEAAEDWCLLLGSAPEVLISWQERDDRGEPLAASPLVQRLDALHRLTWDEPLPSALPFAAAATTPAASLLPAERGALDAIPERLSAAGLQTLLDCPFRYFVRDGLGLRPPEEPRDEMQKRDYGKSVHTILRRFHDECPLLTELGRDAALARLTEVSEAEFAPLWQVDYGARLWWWRWREWLPAYVDWQLAREAEGWRVQPGRSEEPVNGELPLDGGGSIRLYGVPDRVDAGPAGLAVLDYKTGGTGSLKAATEDPSEDAQLTLYAQMIDQVVEVAFVPLDREVERGVRSLAIDAERLAEAIRGHAERLASTLPRIAAGAPLPAMGDESACTYCHARGICRRDHRAAASPA